jgi:hypothetical protein
MATIYRKTAKGQTEIETRALRLPPRLRSALILIDGRRSDEDMRQLILQQPEETLRALSEQGFIEIIAITHEPPAARWQANAAPQPAVPPPPGAGAAPAPVGPAVLPTRGFEATRADAVRGFTDLVGPMAEALAIKMERTRSLDELRPLVQMAQSVIGNARGAQAAAAYLSRVYGSARG